MDKLKKSSQYKGENLQQSTIKTKCSIYFICKSFNQHRVQLYCYRSIKKYVEILKEGVNRVIPQQFLSVFEPHEFEMLLNGPQFIDAQDWKANTLYKGYKSTDQVIIWFWQVVCSYDQEMLANLLHYCTGSNRVPILGFKYLQSNRNTIVKFTIEKVKSDKHNPYPRSYTCFNRI